ncbi:conserved hypothetical protein [Ricinus communis]|uniref:Uncharacterized protein n=1 Tax=Ricinus communis TaxID=3988 RepID=B9S4D2_RICCO|nr:conserved hypothetical protein [Ricinus communis]
MANKASATTVLLIAVILSSLMFQCKLVATRFDMDCGVACHAEKRTSKTDQKHVDMEDDSGSDDQGALGGDYDYYRRYGDVPSPGIGH